MLNQILRDFEENWTVFRMVQQGASLKVEYPLIETNKTILPII